MALNILTDSQVSEYIAGLDLAQGSEAYRTLNAMLLLPKPSFAKAVSAIAQGLVDFAAMRALLKDDGIPFSRLSGSSQSHPCGLALARGCAAS